MCALQRINYRRLNDSVYLFVCCFTPILIIGFGNISSIGRFSLIIVVVVVFFFHSGILMHYWRASIDFHIKKTRTQTNIKYFVFLFLFCNKDCKFKAILTFPVSLSLPPKKQWIHILDRKMMKKCFRKFKELINKSVIIVHGDNKIHSKQIPLLYFSFSFRKLAKKVNR